MRWSRLRTLTQGAVKQGASAIAHGVASDGQLGRLLRKLADEPEAAPVRTAIHVYEPTRTRGDSPRTAGDWARAALPSNAPDAGASDGLHLVEAAPARLSGGSSPRPAHDPRGAFAALAPALPAATPDAAAPELAVGAVIAERYEILRALGHGPAHRVYIARHRAWDIDVVLKLPRSDAAGLAPCDPAADALRWTGLGLHPHVVYCHYVDRIDGLPLLVVEYRAGGTLRPWIASGRTANLRIGLNLAVQICHGLERAHEEGVWHAGLRPENLLFDADGALAVGDFGIAAAAALVRAEGDGPAAARRRELEPYVAPEQWVAPTAIDARTDVFALGVCLYEMFTGRRPYDVARGPRRDPPDPGAHGAALPVRLAALLRRCVDWEPAQRPAGVRDVRAELCAAHEELFRRPSPFAELPERSWEADGWNNQAVALVLLGHAEQADAAWAQALAADPAHLESTYNAGLTRWGRAEVSDAGLLDSVYRAATRRRGDAHAATLLASLHLRRGDAETAIAQLEGVGTERLDDSGRALLESAQQQRGAGARLTATWSGHRCYVSAVQLLDGGQRALSASDDGTLALWTAGQPAPLRVLEGHRGAVATLAISADGQTAISGGDDAALRVWELKTGRCLKTLATGGKVFALAGNADLTRAVVACSGSDNFVGVDATRLLAWDLQRDRPLGELKGHTNAAKCLAMTPDGRLAASGSDDHTVRIWDLTQAGAARRVLSGHQHYVSAVCLSGDGELAVSGGWDTTVRVWEIRSGRCVHVLRGHDGIVNALALSADGGIAVSGGWDRTVRIWDVKSGRCLRTFAAHEGIVSSVALSADGLMAGSGSWDRTVRLWRLPPRSDERFTPRLSRRVTYAQLPSGEPEADELLDAAEDALRAGQLAAALDHVRAARRRATGADAQRAARAWEALAQSCRRTGVRGLQPRGQWTAPRPLSTAPPARGSAALEALPSGVLRVWDPELERARQTLDGHTARVLAMALSADESIAVSAAADRTLRVWDLTAGTCRHLLAGHTSLVAAVALSADACRALSGSYDHTLRLWDMERGRCARIFRGHTRQVTSVACTRDARQAASGDYGGGIRVWDVDDGRCLLHLVGHDAAVTALRISADGTWLLSASADRTLRLWRLETGHCAGVLAGHGAAVLDADVSADDRWALSAARDGEAIVWDLAARRPAASFRIAQGRVDAARIDFDAGRVSTVEDGSRATLWDIDWELVAPPPSDS